LVVRTEDGASPLTVWLEGIGLLGPGLTNWTSGQSILRGESAYLPAATLLPPPLALPAAERRRASKAIQLSLAIAEEAIAAAGLQASTLATVFSSSGGDGYNCHLICETLASDDRRISPTRFHNSVHNAPAGYWSIATGAMAPSTVLCGFDASFAAGLLEAVTQVLVEDLRSVLIAYDTDYPEPLRSMRPIPDSCGVALVLSPHPGKATLARLTLTLTQDSADQLADQSLELLRRSIPAARSLPLLQALVMGKKTRVVIDYLEPLRLAMEVSPEERA
jgi:hypothetical protein